MSAEEARILSLVTETFGEAFVRYVLAIPELVPLPDAMNENRQFALQTLLQSMQQAVVSGRGNVDMSFAAAGVFASFRPDLDGTLAQSLRRSSGGEVEEVETSSLKLLDALRRIARDAWPALLVVPTETGFPRAASVGVLSGVHGHPSLIDACKAFMADSDLAKLFPESLPIKADIDASGIYEIRADWVITTVGGGTRYLAFMPGAIIFHAALLAQRGGGPLTYPLLVNSLEAAVDVFRALSRGETVEVPALIGLHGATVSENEQYEFQFAGTLRGVRKIERELLFNNAESVSCVLETTMPVQLHAVFGPRSDTPDAFFKELLKYAPETEADARTFEQRIDRVRFSLLLASEDEALASTSVVSRYVWDLSNGGSAASWETNTMPREVHKLRGPVAARARRLHQRMQESHPDSLDVAQRRLLSAVSQRWEASDAFIDAVIVWENAFGVHSETTFRVTGAISKLLEPRNVTARIQLQTELKKLYEKRSRLVHGATEPSVEDMLKLKSRAVRVAILALRELYENRVDLLPLSSMERSQKLLLDG